MVFESHEVSKYTIRPARGVGGSPDNQVRTCSEKITHRAGTSEIRYAAKDIEPGTSTGVE